MGHLHAVPSAPANEAGEPAIRPEPEPLLRPAVLKAISAMRERYFDPITITELAAEVFVSPFHFCRIFARATGVTPGRYLTAIRLFEAKRLLLTTTLTVSDVVCSVGYSSVGTFTSRFTSAVGMTPTQYRDPEVDELLVAVAPEFSRLPPLPLLRQKGRNCASANRGTGVINGRIELPAGCPPGDLLAGVFADAVPQRGPVAFTGRMRAGSGDLDIHGVPDGDWVVIAVAEHRVGPGRRVFTTATSQPVRVRSGMPSKVLLRMRPPQPVDPPIAITLAARPTPSGDRVFARRRPELRAVA